MGRVHDKTLSLIGKANDLSEAVLVATILHAGVVVGSATSAASD